jgi:hypothetical protein
MKRFVFWTGVIDAALGAGFFLPVTAAVLLPGSAQGFLAQMFAAVVIFLGVMLIFCARDLRHRGTLVLWEGILRRASFCIMGAYALSGKSSVPVFLGGLFDLVVGVIYLVSLPQHLGMPLTALLLDRQQLADQK